MSSETTTRFTCDGPGCDGIVVSDLPFEEPASWWGLCLPSETADDHVETHFCSIQCLHDWVTFSLIAAEEGP